MAAEGEGEGEGKVAKSRPSTLVRDDDDDAICSSLAHSIDNVASHENTPNVFLSGHIL